MLFSAKHDYSASQWSGGLYKRFNWKQIQFNASERHHWRKHCCKNSSFKLKIKSTIAVFCVIMLLMLMWKNTPILFVISTSTPSPSTVACAQASDCPCDETDDPFDEIVLDYEAEIDARLDDEHELLYQTTVGPPPSVPDEMYMTNLTEPRPLMEFSIEPWKVMENIGKTVHGKNCVHMLPGKEYIPKWALIILVKSKASNFDRRAAIRSTWGRVYFLNQIRIDKVFVVGQVDDPTVQSQLQEENDNFGDLLQFEGPDDYRNMPVKVATAMQWASYNLPLDYMYASSDDDFIVNFVNILDFLEYEVKLRAYTDSKKEKSVSTEQIRTSLPIYCVYYLDRVKGPNRDNTSKWYVNETEYSLERYPPYCGGGFYIMPVAMTRALFRMSRITKLLPMDDVWVTGILRQKLGRGDENVIKAKWPKSEDSKTLWKHLWGDYGRQNKDIAKLLPVAWKEWDESLQRRPHCRWPTTSRTKDIPVIPNDNKLPLVAKNKS